MATSIRERFEDKYIPVTESGCWIWTASINKQGYGQLMVDGRPKGAHRVSYELHVGKITDNLFVLHDCDTPSCVNPNHLHLGTNSDNMKECVERKRHWCRGYHVTHCPKGHEYSEENTRMSGGKRHCKICRNSQQRAYIARKQAVQS